MAGMADARFAGVARWLLDHGVRPNHFTFLQVPVFAGMVWAGIELERWWFFGLSWFVVILDGGDGILARTGGLQSRAGAILDASMDTVGIAVVMWGGTRFFPELDWMLGALFACNVVLYLQNALLAEKWVSYVRGAVLIPIADPDTLVWSLTIGWSITVFLLVWRIPACLRRITGRPAPVP